MLLKDQLVPQPGLPQQRPFWRGDPWQRQRPLIPQPELPQQRPFQLGDPWQRQTIVQPQRYNQPLIPSRTLSQAFPREMLLPSCAQQVAGISPNTQAAIHALHAPFYSTQEFSSIRQDILGLVIVHKRQSIFKFLARKSLV